MKYFFVIPPNARRIELPTTDSPPWNHKSSTDKIIRILFFKTENLPEIKLLVLSAAMGFTVGSKGVLEGVKVGVMEGVRVGFTVGVEVHSEPTLSQNRTNETMTEEERRRRLSKMLWYNAPNCTSKLVVLVLGVGSG